MLSDEQLVIVALLVLNLIQVWRSDGLKQDYEDMKELCDRAIGNAERLLEERKGGDQ